MINLTRNIFTILAILLGAISCVELVQLREFGTLKADNQSKNAGDIKHITYMDGSKQKIASVKRYENENFQEDRDRFNSRYKHRHNKFGRNRDRLRFLNRFKHIGRPSFNAGDRLSRKIWGVAYSPYRADGSCADYNTISKEVIAFSQFSKNIRLYSTDCNQLEYILRAIRENQLPTGVYAGIWVSEGEQRAAKETSDFLKVFISNSDIVKGLSIGNEELFKNSMSEDKLIETIQQIKLKIRSANVPYIPIYTTEVDSLFSRKLADSCDLVQTNVHSAFDDTFISIENSVDSVFNRILALKRRVGEDKMVRVGEAGYPSGGVYKSQPYSIKNQETYANNFICKARRLGLEYFYFEAKDSMWKKKSRELEKNFGLYRGDFTRKFSINEAGLC
ncbi:hypothetical protein BB561_001253 [Smittium simulii]|uniref:glucan endo-1,3-beta-D-glucosidase n=1 Tax=Smittium simulii TaxID=133385 RepID=A0A2T9YVK5_9FUNG|nr:hypothetical protein BB561_001253 [Smittium simulii]